MIEYRIILGKLKKTQFAPVYLGSAKGISSYFFIYGRDTSAKQITNAKKFRGWVKL